MGAGTAPMPAGAPARRRRGRGRRRAPASAPTSFLEGLRRPEVLDPATVAPRRRLLVTVAVVGVLLVAQVWVSLRIQEYGYEIEYVSRISQRLDKEKLELEDAVTRERRSTHVTERAADLGLRMPEAGQVQRISPEVLAEVGLAQP